MKPEEIGRILDEIGERLGPAGEYAWAKTVQYISIQAWAGIGLAIFVVMIAAFLTIRGFQKATWSDDGPTRYDLMAMTGSAILFMAFFIMAVSGPELVSRALVPEGALIKDLLP